MIYNGAGCAAGQWQSVATDSGKLYRSTVARLRARYLAEIKRIMELAGPVHLPSTTCLDIKADQEDTSHTSLG
jgi:hypothetical protein